MTAAWYISAHAGVPTAGSSSTRSSGTPSAMKAGMPADTGGGAGAVATGTLDIASTTSDDTGGATIDMADPVCEARLPPLLGMRLAGPPLPAAKGLLDLAVERADSVLRHSGGGVGLQAEDAAGVQVLDHVNAAVVEADPACRLARNSCHGPWQDIGLPVGPIRPHVL